MKRFCEQLCPKFQRAMDVLAKPWNGYIMVSLAERPLRFSELLARLERIGDRMLSARLKELELRGLVTRRVLNGPPVGVEYELTASGRSFVQMQGAIARWGDSLALLPEELTPRRKKTAKR